MKKILSFLLVAILVFSLLPKQSATAAIKISKKNATMEIDSTLVLKISGTKTKATWKTSKKDIATVDSTGKVTAIAVGQATITAKINKTTYSCIVEVVDSTRKEVTAKKGTVTELSTGTYTIGEDFPAGKYDVKTLSGSGHILAEGENTFINEIFAEEGDEYFDTHTYKNMKLNYGDKLKINSGVVLEFTKLN